MNELGLKDRIAEAKRFILSRCSHFPEITMVLGSGLSDLISVLEVEVAIPFASIPHFRTPSVEGHQGRVVVGKLFGRRIAVLQGRLHYYEGYSADEIVFPVRVLASCGAEIFLLTNAAGGLHSEMAPSELCLITDHINLMGMNPLVGPNEASLGTRFPDLTYVYDPALSQALTAAAEELDIVLRRGVYVALRGPSYETPAEVRMFKILGADLVGMSTVPEAIALRHMDKRVVGISCITNLASGTVEGKLNHEEVMVNAQKAYQNLSRLLEGWLKRI